MNVTLAETLLKLKRAQAPDVGWVTRFAPSPSGYLHLGHVGAALVVWVVKKLVGGSSILRIEDHDIGRSRPEFEQAIVEDLKWLGLLDVDDVIVDQSSRMSRYQAAVDKLKSKGLIYNCLCTRKRLQSLSINQGERGNGELIYDGHCRNLKIPDDREGTVRVCLPNQETRFQDIHLGGISQRPSEQCGDISLRDRNGYWTYHLTNTVDDIEQGVTFVIRGMDLLESTGRQILLRHLLSEKEPMIYLHHPLIVDDQGKKLSKRDLSESIRQLINSGLGRQQIIGLAAFKVGLQSTSEPCEPGHILERLSQ